MEWWTVMSCVLSAVILTSRADPVTVSSPQDSSKPVTEGALMFPDGYVMRRDAVLKERLKESISNLKELLQEEDAHLNERISEGLDRLKEQLKEGDDQLKEELDEDVDRLKEKLAKGQSYLKEELEEGEVKTNEELTKLKEAFEKQQHGGVKQSGCARMDDLRQQMTDFQAELNCAKHQLQTTQTELKTHHETLQSTQADLQTTQEKANSTEEELRKTREQLLEEQRAFTALKAQLEQEIRSLKVEVDSVQSNHDLLSSEMGSTFTRWGRTTCPDNTSLVYSGYVGGQHWDHSGGGSNYLCLVMDPQLDNMTLPARYNKLYGAEYEDTEGQHEQDAVCSVCRAPQVTTLMIPATLSCPPGWTAQYRGHLVSGLHIDKGRNEYVCLDEVREHRDGGHGEANAANFFHVVSQCHSLPCPPYFESVVTCVVCST